MIIMVDFPVPADPYIRATLELVNIIFKAFFSHHNRSNKLMNVTMHQLNLYSYQYSFSGKFFDVPNYVDRIFFISSYINISEVFLN